MNRIDRSASRQLPEVARPGDAPFVTFRWEGREVQGRAGEPLALALWALGIRTLGQHERTGEPRGLYCAIGQCYECRVIVDGRRDRRACLETVREGMEAGRQPSPKPLVFETGWTP